jgi:cell division protein ZapA
MAFQVDIFGQTYALRADADEDHVRRVADLVDLKMREVATGSRSVSTLQIAVLAALDIASEYLQAQTSAKNLVAEVESRSDAMARRIVDFMPEVENRAP